MIKACYIHIPFCKNICSYCDFCKNYYDEKIVSNYLDALNREINSKYKNDLLDTLYIGGGTPSSLSFNNLNKLFNILKVFCLNDDYEFTFEVNYEDITDELLLFLKKNKVNRISIGIQTFNEKYKHVLNRCINKKDMVSSIKLSQKYFDNVNVDLMYALPDESLNDLQKDLDTLMKLKVKHVSIYSLIIEDHTLLSIKKTNETNDELQSNMYYMLIDRLIAHGYNHYELSNFAKTGYESKHNLTYWKNNLYYGFGAGASGFLNNKRYDNTKSIKNYINGKMMIHEENLDKNALMKDEVMLNLRMIKGINKNNFYNKYKIKFEKAFNYKNLVNEKLLIDDGVNVFISKDLLFVSNEVILRLLSAFNLE